MCWDHTGAAPRAVWPPSLRNEGVNPFQKSKAWHGAVVCLHQTQSVMEAVLLCAGRNGGILCGADSNSSLSSVGLIR